MTGRFVRGVALAPAALLLSLSPGATWAGSDEGVVDEVLAILRDRGIVDEAQYLELTSRNAAYEHKQQSLFDRIEWSGDMRLRIESSFYDEDASGVDEQNRTRGRYRMRLGAKIPVNDYVTGAFRLATAELGSSGEGNRRGTNRSFGNDNDFGLDNIFVDRAYLTLTPLPDAQDFSLAIDAGKLPNPFIWKKGKDYMVWDNDINPEGVALRLRQRVDETMSVFGNAGYFIIDENGTSRDPHLTGIQLGVEGTPGEGLSWGARGSWYSYGSLNSDFVDRSAGLGNIADGFTDNGDLSIASFYGYLAAEAIEHWPMLFWGNYAQNLDAESSTAFPNVGEEDRAWGLGLEVGDKKKFAELGLGYWRIESNSVPALFTDSDLFDGNTNRKGWTFYGSREIFPRTELKLELFVSHELEQGPGFDSIGDGDRIRLRGDLSVEF